MAEIRLEDSEGTASRAAASAHRPPGRLAQHPWLALLLIAAALGLVSLTVSGLRLGPGWDEVVYLSQLSRRPAVWFDSARSRGMTFLAAPVTLLTSSTIALRLWVTGVTALAYAASFGTWLRVLPLRTVALAAALLGSTWVTLFYVQEVMPNLWVALAGVAASGWSARLLLQRSSRRASVAVIALLLAGASLVRPSDATLLGAGLAIGTALAGLLIGVPVTAEGASAASVTGQADRRLTAVKPPLRDGLLVGAGAGVGALVGWVAWAVEAQVRFGGVAARLHGAARGNSGGLTWALPDELRSLRGELLCKPCLGQSLHPAAQAEIVFVAGGLLLVIAGLVLTLARARRAARRLGATKGGRSLRLDGSTGVPLPRAAVVAAWLPLPAAVLVAAEYVFFVPYGAPRFLLPTLALMALSAALTLQELPDLVRRIVNAIVGRTARALRPPPPSRTAETLTALCVLLPVAAYLLLQVAILARTDRDQGQERDAWVALSRLLHRNGVRPPCGVFGQNSIPIAYRAQCTEVGLVENPEDPPTRALQFLAEHPGATVGGIFYRSEGIPAFAAGWHEEHVRVHGVPYLVVTKTSPASSGRPATSAAGAP